MPLFYEITSKTGKKNYLFGTLHLSDKQINLLPLEVKSALDSASSLYVEVDYTQMTPYLMQTIIQNWENKFEREHYVWSNNAVDVNEVVREIVKYRPSATNIKDIIKARPPLLALSILVKPINDNIATSMDSNLVRMAKKHNQPVFYLESAESQFKSILGSDLSYKTQREIFRLSLTSKATVDIKQLYLADQIIDVEEIINQFEEIDRPLIRSYYEELITKRDKKMAANLEVPFLKGDAFVAVGALHLKGIVKIFQSKGYTIKSIPITERRYPVLDYYERNCSDMLYTGFALILAGSLSGCLFAVTSEMLCLGLMIAATVSALYAIVNVSFLAYEYMTEPTINITRSSQTNQQNPSRYTMFRSSILLGSGHNHLESIIEDLNKNSEALFLDIEADDNFKKISAHKSLYQLKEAFQTIHRYQGAISQEEFDAIIGFSGDPRELVRNRIAQSIA